MPMEATHQRQIWAGPASAQACTTRPYSAVVEVPDQAVLRGSTCSDPGSLQAKKARTSPVAQWMPTIDGARKVNQRGAVATQRVRDVYCEASAPTHQLTTSPDTHQPSVTWCHELADVASQYRGHAKICQTSTVIPQRGMSLMTARLLLIPPGML
jgi:hypothetical protein